MHECSYCSEFAGDHNASYYLRNVAPQVGGGRIRLESTTFYVYPSVGSLIVGHLLIVPKKHCTALSLLAAVELEELGGVINDIETLHAKILGVRSRHFVFEHGILDVDKSMMNCVDHAHLHVLPVDVDYQALDLSKVKSVELTDLCLVDFVIPDYILYGNSSDYFIAFDRDKHPQYLRKVIHKNLRLTGDWNWRNDAQPLNIIKWLRRFDEFFATASFEALQFSQLRQIK